MEDPNFSRNLWHLLFSFKSQNDWNFRGSSSIIYSIFLELMLSFLFLLKITSEKNFYHINLPNNYIKENLILKILFFSHWFLQISQISLFHIPLNLLSSFTILSHSLRNFKCSSSSLLLTSSSLLFFLFSSSPSFSRPLSLLP